MNPTADQMAHLRAVMLLLQLNPKVAQTKEFVQHILHLANTHGVDNLHRMANSVRDEVTRTADAILNKGA